MKKIWTGLKKILAAPQENFATIPAETPAARPVAARRGKHSDFPNKSMRRGVQLSLERRQRPARLAWITESQRQGVEVRAAFRKAQLSARGLA
jgi:hypothetical protein